MVKMSLRKCASIFSFPSPQKCLQILTFFLHFTFTSFTTFSPTLEEIRSWADSFDRLMRTSSKCACTRRSNINF